jgi:hypothetical protein
MNDRNYQNWQHGQRCILNKREGRYVGHTTTGMPIVEFVERDKSCMEGMADVPRTVLLVGSPTTIERAQP